MDAVDADPPVDAAPVPHARPWWAPLTIAAFLVLLVTARVADGVWARWVETNPEALLAFSARQRYLALTVANGLEPRVRPHRRARIALVFVVCHLAGRAYREDLLRIFTRYLGLTPEAIESFDRGLDKAEIVIIPFFVGSNILAVLTGIRRTHPLKLGILLAIGIAGRLALFWWLAKTFEEPLVDFLTVVQRYQWWVVAVSVIAVVLVNVRNYRRGSPQG